MSKILVKSGSVDQNIANNINHNITSTNLNYAFENINDYIELVKNPAGDGYIYRLKENLFTIQIGNDTVINSSAFYERVEKHQR